MASAFENAYAVFMMSSQKIHKKFIKTVLRNSLKLRLNLTGEIITKF